MPLVIIRIDSFHQAIVRQASLARYWNVSTKIGEASIHRDILILLLC